MLVDNQWALTRARRAQLSQLFELLAGLRGEDDRAVLDAIADPLTWLSTHAVGDEFRPAFERFVAEIFSPLLDKLGWDPRPTDTTDDRETRARVLGLLGRTAGLRTVQEEARRRIEAHLNGTQRLDPDLAGPLASVAATHGDAALYDRYVQRMREAEATDAQEEARFRGALAAFEDPALVQRTAEACFDTSIIRVQDRGLMLFSLLGTRYGRGVTWPIVRAHWDTDVAPLDSGVKHRVIGALGQVTPRDLAEQVAAFLKAKRAPDTAEVTAQALERLRLGTEQAQRLGIELQGALARIQ
jgi:aminopeptidase N